ncbi:MAG TPA: ATP-binding cassette domain-containing protein, partial [Hyalangium sp.]|nr:ATP-binding cassette domain-containing protein [Hyalangium sp.]
MATPPSHTPVLEVVSLEKAYGPLKAVQGLSFQVAPGEVLGLVGPNGAGKTVCVLVCQHMPAQFTRAFA